MAIEVEIQDESGRTLARYDGPALGLEFTRLAPPGSACFRFIEPWCDTTFNQAQIEVLKDELLHAVRDNQHQAARRLLELEALSGFLAGAVGVHVYVKFIGD
jgi:hypothetical protein